MCRHAPRVIAPPPSTPSSTEPTNRVTAARLLPSGILGPFSLSAGCSDDAECCRRGQDRPRTPSLQPREIARTAAARPLCFCVSPTWSGWHVDPRERGLRRGCPLLTLRARGG